MNPVLLVIAGPMINLDAAIAIADRLYVYDNSVDNVEARLCARTVEGRLKKIYAQLPDWVSDAIRELPRDPDFVDLRGS